MSSLERVLSYAKSLRPNFMVALVGVMIAAVFGTATPAAAEVPTRIKAAAHEEPVVWEKPYDVTLYFSADQMITQCKDRATGQELYDCGEFVPYYHVINHRKRFSFTPIQGRLKGYRFKASPNIRVTEIIAYYIEDGAGEFAPIFPRTVPPTNIRLPLYSTVPNPFTGEPMLAALFDVEARGIRGTRVLPFP